jgi:4-amino-4-deoxy-L-arabinose transferase-like glycosyltransferase
MLFAWLWFGVVFVFFSLSGTKLPSYIFPAFPALALLAGGCGHDLFHGAETKKTRVDKAFDWVVVGIAGPLAVGLCLAPLILSSTGTGVSLGLAPYLLAAVFALGPGLTMLAKRRGQGNAAIAALTATMVLIILLSVRLLIPPVQDYHHKDLREGAEAARQQLGPDDLLVTYELNAPSLVFYARRRVVKVGRCEEYKFQELASSGRLFIVARADEETRLREIPGIFPLDRRGRYVLYSSRPSGEVADTDVKRDGWWLKRFCLPWFGS